MTTFIDTTRCERIKLDDISGEMAEIVNRDLCGAEDVLAMLRWLKGGQKFEAASLRDTHQLVYLMEGDGVINLDGKDYDVTKGAGVYLGPEETATVAQTGTTEIKLLHLLVPIIEGR
jgi:glyoxylate utilization-related uncharacterized protein